jgi:hypothetical protein
MKIGLITLAYTQGGYTEKQLSVIENSKHDIRLYLFLHTERFSLLTEECIKILGRYGNNCSFFNYGYNRGFSKSVNDGIYRIYSDRCDIAMFIPQDVSFENVEQFDSWIDKAQEFFESKYFISGLCSETDIAPFSMWLYTKKAFKEVGAFDENFFPTQYEDIDMHRRCSFLTNHNPKEFFKTPYRTNLVIKGLTHSGMLGISDVTTKIQQYYITAPLNKLYFTKKWGGVDGTEHFTTPFNNNQIGLKINWDCRNNPYNISYDRKDQNIVKV